MRKGQYKRSEAMKVFFLVNVALLKKISVTSDCPLSFSAVLLCLQNCGGRLSHIVHLHCVFTALISSLQVTSDILVGDQEELF